MPCLIFIDKNLPMKYEDVRMDLQVKLGLVVFNALDNEELKGFKSVRAKIKILLGFISTFHGEKQFFELKKDMETKTDFNCPIITYLDETDTFLGHYILGVEKVKFHREDYVLDQENFMRVMRRRIKYNIMNSYVNEMQNTVDYVPNLIDAHSNMLKWNNDKIIELKPEHKQAGLQILNYFQETLNQKYPDNNVTVRISQKGNSIAMEILTPEGITEKYEKAFEEFGLVVTGEKPVEEFLPDKVDQLAMKQMLREANNKIENQRELLQMKSELILTLQEDKRHFMDEIKKITRAYIRLSDRLSDLIEKAQAKDDIKNVIQTLDAALSLTGPKELTQELDTIKKNNKGLFDWLGSTLGKVGEKVIVTAGSHELYQYLMEYFKFHS